MKATFADTSFLIALLRVKDVHHQRALAWQKVVTGRLLTTEYILLEFADAMSVERLRRRAVETIGELRGDASVQVVSATTALIDEGLAFFGNHSDKRWSLTDCISFVVMRRESVSEALTSDHHFEQAGFRALLRAEPSEA
ncbi:MAG: type II toxin-antitoxin system VapC family toxin [Planctomycetes bacterium]|nr:type II toxin-antitoxin system VapC family toxin [Planctomycetota bacterium]